MKIRVAFTHTYGLISVDNIYCDSGQNRIRFAVIVCLKLELYSPGPLSQFSEIRNYKKKTKYQTNTICIKVTISSVQSITCIYSVCYQIFIFNDKHMQSFSFV